MDKLVEQKYIKDRVKIDSNTGCWEWNQMLNENGYGQCTRNKVGWMVHRLSYTAFTSDIPEELIVRHMCHNPKCCNPDHLELGTHKDNWQDSESVHRTIHAAKADDWIIHGVVYGSSREAQKATKLTPTILVKYTDKTTRVFDVQAYRIACEKSNRWTPKV